MQVVKAYPDNLFSWVDLATTDPDGAKAFYTGLFGWDFVDNPVSEDMVYTIFQLEGRDVAALNKMRPEQQAQGIPPHWFSYVTVDNVEEWKE